MEFIKEKSILIIAPSLIAESLSLKLTSLDKNLNITLNNSTEIPDLIIWNVLNYQSEDLLRLELLGSSISLTDLPIILESVPALIILISV